MSREIIQMASRRIREGSGSYSTGPSEQWVQDVPDMAMFLEDIAFVLIGGLATRLYMPERMTLDVDVLIHAEDHDEAGHALTRHGATQLGPLSIGGSSWRLVQGRIVDLIALNLPWVGEAIRHARKGPDGQPYADLPWLVLLKLSASRSQDLADCARMLGAASDSSREAVRQAVKRYRPEDMDDVDSLIRLGKLENKTHGNQQ
jgi:hypothetical protein